MQLGRDHQLDRLPNRPRNAPRVAALTLGILSAVWLAACGLCVPQYQTNDDASMSLIASGHALVDAPSPQLIFSHVLLGRGLAALYRAFPGVPWYGLHLQCALAGSAVVLVALGATLGPIGAGARRAGGAGSGALRWALPLATAAVVFYLARNLQFTCVAYLVTLSGIALIGRMSCGAVRPWGRAAVAPAAGWGLGVLLVTYGSLIRLESCLLALAVTGTATVIAWGIASRSVRESQARRPSPPALTAATSPATPPVAPPETSAPRPITPAATAVMAPASSGIAPGGTVVARLVLAAVVVSVGIAGLAWQQQLAYRAADPRWDAFFQHFQQRQRVLYLAPRYQAATADAFAAVGWSSLDWQLYQDWLAFDRPRFATATLSEFCDRYRQLAPSRGASRLVRWTKDLLRTPVCFQIALLLPLVLLSSCRARGGGSALGMLVSLIVVMLALGILAATMRAPLRLIVPLLVTALFFPLWEIPWIGRRNSFADDRQPDNDSATPAPGAAVAADRLRTNAAAIVASLLAVLSVGWMIADQWQASRAVVAANRRLQADLNQIGQHCRAGDLYITAGGSLPLHHLLPLQTIDWPADLRLVSHGWPVESPPYLDRLSWAGPANPAVMLLERPQTYLLCGSAPARRVQQYYQQQLGKSVALERIAGGDSFQVYRVRSAAETSRGLTGRAGEP